MASNSLTNRRRTARKPPVCHSGPAVDSILFPPGAIQLQRTPLEKKLPGITSPIVPRTGRCPPPQPDPNHVISCNVEIPDPIETGNDYQLDVTAQDTGYTWTQIVTVQMTALLGKIDPPELLHNDVMGNATYYAPSNPGEETVTSTFSWPDGHQAISVEVFDVDP